MERFCRADPFRGIKAEMKLADTGKASIPKGGGKAGGKGKPVRDPSDRTCFQCRKPLDDRAAHPEGRSCKRPEVALAADDGPASDNSTKKNKKKIG